jgi:hypothetical protein
MNQAVKTPERWSGWSLERQFQLIANEMNRAAQLLGPADRERRRNAYERVLQLTNVTLALDSERELRRDLLRWRDLVALLYAQPGADASAHAAAWRSLLTLTPNTIGELELAHAD